MPDALRGKTALVTGASRRLGRAIALGLAAEGSNIVVHYRSSAAEAAALCREVRALGVQGWMVDADLADPAANEQVIPRALAAAGTLDILVNNASIFPSSTLENVTPAQLRQSMEVNAWAPFLLSRSFARLVGQGAIINMLDSRITGYDWTHVAYLLSKHALAELTRMSAVEFAPGITVNAVAPGLVLPPEGETEAYLEQRMGSLPLKRHGSAEDVADAVVFLARSRFITGEVLFIDGGRHLLEYGHG